MNKTLLSGIAIGGVAFGVLAAGIAQPVFAADPSNGQRLAMRWCAACHVVTNAQREANADAPPFEDIAKRFSEPGLTTFLLDPHAKMPDMNLPNTRSPTVSELATTPGMTVGALMVALTTPHAGIPMFVLTATQREDIIAYILSLR
jgi:hypothetical protein